MSKKYGQIDLSTEEFYNYIGTVGYVSCINGLIFSTSNVFDIEIKAIKYIDQYNSQKELLMNQQYNEQLSIFNWTIIDSCIEYFTLYFESEEIALYFKMKYGM